ncbi:hypothetical protein [Sporosarcina sp. NPDC096371]|uniref:hypothetical protein n=1 Tax=Sporosarcina sp. NPDC096371 TaxID=3364530 RepID=UPI00380E1597
MMQHGQWNSNQMHGMHGMHGLCGGCNKMHNQCGCNKMQPSNQMQPIVCPPQYRCHDSFVRQEVPVIQPIVNVNRVHNVIVPRRYVTETTRNVQGSTVFPAGGQQFGGGYGPQMGGYGGPGFGGPGFGGPGFGGPGFGGPGFGRGFGR